MMCSSASSAYRPSSVAASRSSMPRRSASASNAWLILVISLVLISCLPGRCRIRTPGTTMPRHRQRAVKTQVSAHAATRERPSSFREFRTTMTRAMLEIRVIGELEVRLAGTKAQLPASRRVRALLGWLAVHPGRHPRSRLAGQFWPDVLDTSARASLRSAIWALRSSLGPDFGSYLVTDRDTVTLAADGLSVDLWEVRRLIAHGQPRAALDLCRGELLQELDDDWVVEAREELDRDIAAALLDLMEQATAAGDSAAAAGWARRRAALCPLDESAGADLIRALIAAGDAPAALAALAKLRERLDSELGIDVSAQTAALVRRLQHPAARPGGVGRNVHRGSALAEHVLEPVAGLVGREENFAELVGAWRAARSGCGGAVLLEGEGGIGKTRLVEELQGAALRAAPDATLIAGTTAAGPGRAAPFAIWTDALSDLVSLTGRPPATLAWTADLARIVPALAQETARTGPAAVVPAIK